jgi:tetratricopeptide (TPR) repeat protein
MSPETGAPPLRVEQVLRLLPDIDALAPFRAFLVSMSRARTSSEPYRTVGKRFVQPSHLRELVPRAIERVSEHLAQLYEAAVEALEAQERGDMTSAVRAFLRAGEREEEVGRGIEAHTWYENALRLAEELRDRQPEIESLHHLGRLERMQGSFENAARRYQRSLVLADAEGTAEAAALSCEGLGEVSFEQEKLQGAASWYARGLRHAGENKELAALLTIGSARVAYSRGDLATADERLQHASETLLELRHAEGMARLHNAWGTVHALRGRLPDALLSYREAIARLQGMDKNAGLEMDVRINICQLYLEWGRLPDAEDEIRRAEEIAIAHNFIRQLAQLYLVMGKVSGRQRDETGFVFFEQAIELCRGREPFPRLEAEAYREYGRFKKELGEVDEARAFLERAREILDAIGDVPGVTRLEGEIASLGAY